MKNIGKRSSSSQKNLAIEQDVGIIGIEVQGIQAHPVAIFGDEGIYLLGATMLEELGLEVDPVKRELRPVELLPMLN